jgi:hypothetical protein
MYRIALYSFVYRPVDDMSIDFVFSENLVSHRSSTA